ncbi:MAG: hypothetical protein ABIZ49_11275, partial [Opitutaceae bacterium]
AIGLALFSLPVRAAGPTVESRVDRLHQLVTLTTPQKTRIVEIFRLEDTELAALTKEDRLIKGMDSRQASRARVRAALTPAQQKIYDRAPQMSGGGLTIPTAENRLARLDESVTLTAAQKKVALLVYEEEFESLVSLSPAERPEKGMPFRQAARDQIRAVLTPDQLAKMDGAQESVRTQANAERTAIENQLRASSGLVAHLGAIVSFTMNSSMMTVAGVRGGEQKGTYTFRVVGATGTDTITASWEKSSATAPIRITGLVNGSGKPIPL